MLRALALAGLFACGLIWAASTHAEEMTGTIEGRVYYRDFPDRAAGNQPMILVPSKLRDVLSFTEALRDYSVAYDSQTGTFTISGITPGKYLLGLKQNPDVLPTFEDTILLSQGSTVFAFPATTIDIVAGQTTSVDIPLVIPPKWLTPEPTPTCFPQETATISGRIEFIGTRPNDQAFDFVGWIPSDTVQPVNPFLFLNNQTFADQNGNYVIRCLRAGEYFVFLGRSTQLAEGLAESVVFHAYDDTYSIDARRVRVGNGETASGIDFTVVIPTPELVIDFPPTPTPIQHTEGPQPYDDVSLPPAGTGPSQSGINPWILLATVAAAGLTAGAIALRRRPKSNKPDLP